MDDRKIRSIFISDLHLGSRYSRAKLVYDFLNGKQIEHLYLVGDIIDGWKFSYRSWYWDESCNDLVRLILKMGKKGTNVHYIVGNHDEFLRKFFHWEHNENSFGAITFTNSVIHSSADGGRYLVVHGDAFDAVIQYTPWMAWLGDIGYEALLRLNFVINYLRKRFGLKHWSFSKYAKQRVKEAASHIGKFEEHLVKTARQEGCCGVISGHIHCVADKVVDGIRYFNCGDWVESCTSLLEYDNGDWEIFEQLK